MKTLEVPPEYWERFCKEFQELCQGAVASVECVQSNGTVRRITRDVPLRAVVWDDKSDRCNHLLVIDSGLPDEKSIRHVVVEPIYMRLKGEAEEARYNCLQVVAENGTTQVDFHPGLSEWHLKNYYLHTTIRQGSGAGERSAGAAK